MNQLDPNVGANARYRMNARLEDAQRRRIARAAEGKGDHPSTISRVSRWLRALVTRSTIGLRVRRSLGTMRARDFDSDVGADRPPRRSQPGGARGTAGTEVVVDLAELESTTDVEIGSDPDIARSGHAVPADKS
jgi:hypothetical protein